MNRALRPWPLAAQLSSMASDVTRHHDEELAKFLGVRVEELETMLADLTKRGLRVEPTVGPAEWIVNGREDRWRIEEEISFEIVRAIQVRRSLVAPYWQWYCRECIRRGRSAARACGYARSCDEANNAALAHWHDDRRDW